MNVVSLCSGVGLIDLGLEWAGLRTIQLCELDGYATRILEQRYPGVPIHDDVWTINPAACDIIAAGFPCQPFSVAGKQLGDADPRHLWPAIIRSIRLVRPRYVLLENVAGLVAWGLGEVLGDLAAAGYDAEWTCFNASDIGAPHKRRRWWCVATSDADRSRVWDADGGFFREAWATSSLAWTHGETRPVADTDDIGRLGAHRRTAPGTHRHQDRAQPVGDRERSRTGDVADTTSKRTREPTDETVTVTDGGDTWVEPSGGSQLSGDVPHADSSAIQPRRIGWGARETSRPGWWATEPAVGRTPDGSAGRMDGGELDGHEIVRTLWGASGPQALQREAGGQRRVPKTRLLQPGVYGERLCQACTVARWAQVEGCEAPWELLRGMWSQGEASSPSHRRECAKQLSQQHPDLVRLLSHIPPPPCAACWSDGSWESGVTRTAHGVPSRMDRLRCLGNGVVPQCAELIGLRLRQLDTPSG